MFLHAGAAVTGGDASNPGCVVWGFAASGFEGLGFAIRISRLGRRRRLRRLPVVAGRVVVEF